MSERTCGRNDCTHGGPPHECDCMPVLPASPPPAATASPSPCPRHAPAWNETCAECLFWQVAALRAALRVQNDLALERLAALAEMREALGRLYNAANATHMGASDGHVHITCPACELCTSALDAAARALSSAPSVAPPQAPETTP